MGKTQAVIKKTFKKLRRRAGVLVIPAIVLGSSFFIYAGYMANKRIGINPAAHAPLLNLIARVESSGNYNAYFGNSQNSEIDFTAMSVEEVMAWQEEFVRQGSASSAVGRYQIINTTLGGLVRQLQIDTTQKFDKPMQDRMAVALLEKRGVVAYVNNEITRDEFAANIAKEWAALPKIVGDKPEESYYASDGLNRSLVAADEVLDVIEKAYP